MSKSRNQVFQTRPKVIYKAKSRGGFSNSSTVYAPVKPKPKPTVLPDPRSCFYKLIKSRVQSS